MTANQGGEGRSIQGLNHSAGDGWEGFVCLGSLEEGLGQISNLWGESVASSGVWDKNPYSMVMGLTDKKTAPCPAAVPYPQEHCCPWKAESRTFFTLLQAQEKLRALNPMSPP